MTIVQRVSRLFKADMNELLDKLEEPKAALKQALRDKEAEMRSLQGTLQVKEKEFKQIGERQKRLQDDIATAEAQLQLCLNTKGRDDLAKSCMRRRLELAKLLAHLGQAEKNLSEKLAEDRLQYADFEQKHASIRQKVEVMVDLEEPATTATGTHFAVTDEEVELALLQRQKGGKAHAE